MARYILLFLLCIGPVVSAPAASPDPAAARRHLQDAEYYQRQADSYARDAEYYLRQAKSHESDAQYYLRLEKYDRARDYFRRAASAMDTYQDKMNSARNAASRAEDYLRRAADALY